MEWNRLRGYQQFGVNKIFLAKGKMKVRLSYYTSINVRVVEQSQKEIMELAEHVPVFLPLHTAGLFPEYNHNFMFFRAESRNTNPMMFSKDPRQFVAEGYTVTYASLQVAHWVGCRTVFLIGVDHHFIQSGAPNSAQTAAGPDPNHFDSSYFGKGTTWDLADLDHSENAYRSAKDNFAADGRAIIDVTIGGHLQIFPKMNFFDVFPTSPADDGRKPS